jgi:aryl-alcohol dehydrogenase-like predicted oxidoreductase
MSALVPRRRLGATGPFVSALGLGCMQIGSGGAAGEARAHAALARALELGIDFFDTADVYGSGASETALAPFLAGARDRVFLATKFGQQPAGSERRVDGRPEYVARACEESLRRLRVDVIDLYYQHRVDPEVPIEDTMGAMKRLVEQGKVRYLGLSEAAPATLRRAHAVHPVTALQTEYSLWTRDPENEVLRTCRELGVGFVAYSPLGRGMLAGAVAGEASLAADDWRRRHPRFQGENLTRNVAAVRPLERIAQRMNATPAQVALAWVLAREPTIVPIPGTTNPAHLASNAAAASLAMRADDLAQLDAAFPPGVAAGARHNDVAMRYMNG